MGYRHYFARANKKEVESIQKMNRDEFVNWAIEKDNTMVDEWNEKLYVDSDIFVKGDCFEFGKLYHCDAEERIYKMGEPLFYDEEIQEDYEDYCFYIVGKEGVLEAIEVYKDKIRTFIEDMRSSENRDDKFLELIREKLFFLNYKIDLSDDKDVLTKSWLYEDSIFNLVAVYKNTDWETETIVFYGR